MRVAIAIVFFLSLTTSGFSQFKGLEIGAGAKYTFIPDQTKESTSIPSTISGFSFSNNNVTTEETYQHFFGFDFGSKAEFILGEKLSAKIGLGFNYTKFKRDTRIISSDPTINSLGTGLQEFLITNGEVFGEVGDLSDLFSNGNDIIGDPEKGPAHIIYLSIPLELTYSLSSKIYGTVGFSIDNRIYSRTKGDVIQFDRTNFQYTVEEQTFTDGAGLNRTQFFTSLGIGYRITDKLGIELSYERGLSAIFEKDNQIAGPAKYNQLGLNITYQILKGISKK